MSSSAQRQRIEPGLGSDPVAQISTAPRRVEVRRASLAGRLRHYLRHHVSLLTAGIGPLKLTVMPALFACLVVGAMLALALAAVSATQNLQRAAGAVSEGVQATLFLKLDVAPEEVTRLVQALEAREEVASVRHIPPEQGLQELRQVAEVDAAMAVLEANPLPHVLVVKPSSEARDPESVRTLGAALGQEPAVEIVQLDLDWAEKLGALLRVLEEAGMILGSLLAVAVALVIGNTVRLAVDARREEIEVLLLVGATRRYVRRPYLYAGAWLGALGALVGWWVVNLGLWWLRPGFATLAQAYGSDFELVLLGWESLLPLLAAGALVGWLGAWLSAGHQLRRFVV